MQDRRVIEEDPEKRNKEYIDFCDKYVNNLQTNVTINYYLPGHGGPIFAQHNDENDFDFYDLYDQLNN